MEIIKTSTQNEKASSFLVLKNDQGEDIYAVDKLGDSDSLCVSQTKQPIDMFENLTVYNPDMEKIGTINMSEIFVSALYDLMESNKTYGNANIFNDLKEEKVTPNELLDSFLKSKIVFRQAIECFPDGSTYEPPNTDKILGELETIDQLVTVDQQLTENATKKGTQYNSEPKIGRNDPCPCGSGNKFKVCCGK